MGRPPVKATLALTKAKVKAELQAKASWKKTKQGYESSLRDHIGLMIDKINPLELLASIGLTIAIHKIIVDSQELLIKSHGTEGLTLSQILLSPGGTLGTIVSRITEQQIREWLGLNELTAEQLKAIEAVKNDPAPWLISFGIAYFLIHNGQQVASLPATVAGFFGMVSV